MRKHIRGIVLVLLILLLPCLVWAEDEPENDIEITLQSCGHFLSMRLKDSWRWKCRLPVIRNLIWERV